MLFFDLHTSPKSSIQLFILAKVSNVVAGREFLLEIDK